jgi:hypothetical protein
MSASAHGLSVTLLSGAPLAIINGPVRHQIGLNCGHNALGHGFRANATIGRALRLVFHRTNFDGCLFITPQRTPGSIPTTVLSGFQPSPEWCRVAYPSSSLRRTTSPARPAKKEVRGELAAQCDAIIEALSSWGSCSSCSSHDVTYFEGQGIPTANIATTEFVEAARLQCTNLGFPSSEVITVPHPIVPLPKEEIRARADVVIDTIVSRLVTPLAQAAAL